MTITTVFQQGINKLFILGLIAVLGACGGGGKSNSQAAISSVGLSSVPASSIAASSIPASSSVISVMADTTPDTFSFTAVTGAAVNASVSTAAVTISGINTATPISITGGQYAIDSGALTSSAGTITNGQTVKVTLLTSAAPNTTTQAVLTVGGVTGTFSAMTVNLVGGAIQGASLNIATVVTTLAGAAPKADGTGSAARFQNPGGTVSDGTNLYVADTENYKIRKIVIATGVVTTLAGSGTEGSADGTGTAASFNYPYGITTDGTNLYVADTNNNTIRKIVIATGVVTTLAGTGSIGRADGKGAAASFYYPAGITTDGTNLYVADTENSIIRKIVIATGVVTTLAGNSSGSADGTGTAASFFYPNDITTDGTNLYVADTDNNTIRKIVIATGVVTTLAGSGTHGSTDGTGTAAIFYYPSNITTDGTDLYVADRNNHKIRKIVIVTGVVTTLAGSGTHGSTDGTGTAASFYYPSNITTDGTNLYVADTGNSTIRKIVIATGVVTTLAGNSSSSADGTGTAASFYSPYGITTDGANLYVADTRNSTIRKIVIATGVVTTLAGTGSSGSADGTGTAASFYYPQGITTDGTNLYVADTINSKIRKIVLATSVVTTLAGSGLEDSADGTGTAASFNYPFGITTDGTNLYVADTNNSKIRKIVLATGVVTTLAGSGSSGSADGTGTAVSFSYPQGITTDGTNLYVADTDNNTIRKIVIATSVVTTLAGSGSSGSADGSGMAASFNYPFGITTDGIDLFVTDNQNNTIRKIH